MSNNVIKNVNFEGRDDSFYEMNSVRRYFTESMEKNDSEAIMELVSLINKEGVILGTKVC
jgi:cysteine synthase